MPCRPPLAAGVAGAAIALVAACSSHALGSVDVAPVSGLTAAALSVCTKVSRALPNEVAKGVKHRATQPASPTTAAWGDPAIVLRCGVPGGSLLDDDYTFNGVDWAMHDTGATRTWTTLDRAVNVSVVIPDAYDGQAELLGGLANALKPTRR